jgi:hypothetical protein
LKVGIIRDRDLKLKGALKMVIPGMADKKKKFNLALFVLKIEEK